MAPGRAGTGAEVRKNHSDGCGDRGAVVGITVFRKHRKRKKDAALLANEDEVNEEPDETVDKESKNP